MTSLFQCRLFHHLPASWLLFVGVLNTNTHTHTHGPVVAVNTCIMCIYVLFVCLCVLPSPEKSHPPPSHLHCYYMTSPSHGFYYNKCKPLFSLPLQSLINTEQKVLIQPLIHGRGTGNTRGFECEGLREHQMNVDRKPSQLII